MGKKKQKSRSKHRNVQVWKKYSEGAKPSNPFCPRCGPGVFLALHPNRKTCGKCGYSELSHEKKE